MTYSSGPPPAPGSPAPHQHPRNNGLAVASLVLGLVGLLLFVLLVPPILAIIFGAVAVSQINKSGGWQSGHGMAVAGIVLGALELIALVALVAAGGNYEFHVGG
ncbi:MAG: DUF4190 domain-containing protein [Actinomycetota bacterium]